MVSIHLFWIFAYYLIIYVYPLAVQVNGHQRIAIITATHVQGTYHQAIDAVGLIQSPTVVMPALVSDDGILFENIHISAVIIQVIKNRIMVDAKHPHAGLYHHRESAVEPQEVFLLDVAVAHLHERPAVHAHNHQVIDREYKAVTPPQVVEGFAGALAPVVLVVAGNDIKRMRDIVKYYLDVA